MSFTIRASCRLCDAPLPDERVLDLGETPLANALVDPLFTVIDDPVGFGFQAKPLGPVFAPQDTYPLFLKQCATCGHVQLPVVVDPKLLFPADYPYASATGAAMRRHLDQMADDLWRGLDISTHPLAGLVVEIGSNDGYLVERFRTLGVRAIGVDPAGNLAAKATRDGQLTVPDFFGRHVAAAIRNACGTADLVVANNVFAHADDLHEIVEGVKVLLAREGRFVFEVGFLGSVLWTNNFPAVYHEHLSVHHLASLIPFLEKHGLYVRDAELVPTQGGSMRCYVSREKREPAARVADVLAAERIQLKQLMTWQFRVDTAATRTREYLGDLKRMGKTIAGYGCSAKSTTLLHVAGIGRETIDFICDAAPTKQGKFSPGKHIPIVHPDELEKRQPDYCVSLSGNFSEAFRARHPNYRGAWIEPDLSGQSVAA